MKKSFLFSALMFSASMLYAQNDNLALKPVGEDVTVTVTGALIKDGAEIIDNEKAKESADGNPGTRWGTNGSEAGAWFQIQWSEAQSFNTVKILCEGAMSLGNMRGAGFDILTSNDGTSWTTQKSLTGADACAADKEYISIVFDNVVSAKYVRMLGTTPDQTPLYGYSFWEFEVYNNDYSVLTLTSIELSATSAICKVGESIALTTVVRDQYGDAMDGQTVSYTVSPADAGSVENGIFTAAKFGNVTITATSADVVSNEANVFNYSGDNVALNKTVTGEGFNDASRLVDDADNTEYQADPKNGADGQDVTCGFVIDLGAKYDISLITIHFEGACSDAYTLSTSADNKTFASAHSYTGTNGIKDHTDYIYGDDLSNNTGVRYVKFESTKNATGWGMKIFEFKVFGVASSDNNDNDDDSTPTAVENITSKPAVDVIYNLNGQRLNAPVKGQINIINGKKVIVM